MNIIAPIITTTSVLLYLPVITYNCVSVGYTTLYLSYSVIPLTYNTIVLGYTGAKWCWNKFK